MRLVDADQLQLGPLPNEEPRREHGTLWNTWATFTLFLRRPTEALDRMVETESFAEAWLFAVLIQWPIYCFHMLAAYLSLHVHTAILRSYIGVQASEATFTSGLLSILVQPLSILLSVWIGGWILHGCLWMWRGLNEGRSHVQTMRTQAYLGAILEIPPFFLPTSIASLPTTWVTCCAIQSVLIGLALSRVHRTTWWKGIAASATPQAAIILAAWILRHHSLLFWKQHP